MHKYIYWRPDQGKNSEGHLFANVHLLVGYNPGAITDFQEMANELRKTFPQASDDKIYAGKIHESRYVKNHSIITWNAHIPESEYPGWHQFREGAPPEYGW